MPGFSEAFDFLDTPETPADLPEFRLCFCRDNSELTPADFMGFQQSDRFVVTERAAEFIIRMIPSKSRLYPADVEGHIYYVWHLVNFADVVDVERSDLRFFPGGKVIMRVRQIVLRSESRYCGNAFRSVIPGVPGFFVSECFRAIYYEEGLTGLRFVPVPLSGDA